MLNGIQLGRPGLLMVKKCSDYTQHFLLVVGSGCSRGGFSSVHKVSIRFIFEAPGGASKRHSHMVKGICTNQACVIWSVGSFPREVHLVVLKDFAHKHSIGQRVIGELDDFLHRVRDDFRPIDANVGFERVDEKNIIGGELGMIAVARNQDPSSKEREHPFVFLHSTGAEDVVVTFSRRIPQTTLVDV